MFEFCYQGTDVEYKVFMDAVKAKVPSANIRLCSRTEDPEVVGRWDWEMEILRPTKDDIFRVGMITAMCYAQFEKVNMSDNIITRRM